MLYFYNIVNFMYITIIDSNELMTKVNDRKNILVRTKIYIFIRYLYITISFIVH